MRLFFALPLPEPVRARAALVQERLRAGAGQGAPLSFTKTDQLHFTLAFLGEQPAPGPALAAGEAACAGAAPFAVALGGAGAFPSAHRPRVLWLGLAEGAPELTALAKTLARNLREQGIGLEDRPFHPHLTLARVKPGGERIAAKALLAADAALVPSRASDPRASAPAAHLIPAASRFVAAELHLIQSILGRAGATHLCLARLHFMR